MSREDCNHTYSDLCLWGRQDALGCSRPVGMARRVESLYFVGRGPDLVDFGPTLGHSGPVLVGVGRLRATVGRRGATFGWAPGKTFGRAGSKSVEIGPHLVKCVLFKSLSNVANIGQIRSNSARVGRNRPKVDQQKSQQIQSSFERTRSNLANLGQLESKSMHGWPKSVKLSPNRRDLADIGQSLVNLDPNLGESIPKLVETGPNLDERQSRPRFTKQMRFATLCRRIPNWPKSDEVGRSPPCEAFA